MRKISSLLLLAVGSACGASPWPAVPAGPAPVAGTPDHRAEAVRLRQRLEAGADDVDTIVWFGRRLAYLGRVDDAIAAYTEGLRRYPGEPHLLRHRGHRWITVRSFAPAVADLEAAQAAIVASPDEVEPDGQPNARGIPTSTLRTNVLYHLGLARRLTGDHLGARDAFAACVDASTTVDMAIAARSWLCLTLWSLELPDDAVATAAAVAEDADVIENFDYHRLCMLYSGRRSLDRVVGEVAGEASATLAYGVGSWLLADGRYRDGVAWLRRAVADGAPAAFGRIAAEVDLARLEPGARR